jgi:hypothetical protein
MVISEARAELGFERFFRSLGNPCPQHLCGNTLLSDYRGGCHEHWRGNKKGVPISWDAHSRVRELFGLELARGLVRFVSQIEEEIEKLLRLADEEPVIDETLKRGNSAAELSGRRANDGDGAQAGVDEMGWLGHDQVGLQCIAVERLGIRLALGRRQSGERYGCARASRSVVRVGNGKSVPGLVLPGLKMHSLARSDAEQDSQNLEVCYLLRERGI